MKTIDKLKLHKCRLCDNYYEADLTIVGAEYECPYCHLKIEVVPAPEGFYDAVFLGIAFPGMVEGFEEE